MADAAAPERFTVAVVTLADGTTAEYPRATAEPVVDREWQGPHVCRPADGSHDRQVYQRADGLWQPVGEPEHDGTMADPARVGFGCPLQLNQVPDTTYREMGVRIVADDGTELARYTFGEFSQYAEVTIEAPPLVLPVVALNNDERRVYALDGRATGPVNFQVQPEGIVDLGEQEGHLVVQALGPEGDATLTITIPQADDPPLVQQVVFRVTGPTGVLIDRTPPLPTVGQPARGPVQAEPADAARKATGG